MSGNLAYPEDWREEWWPGSGAVCTTTWSCPWTIFSAAFCP